MADTYKFKDTGINLYVRRGAGNQYDMIRTLYGEDNETYTAYAIKGEWIKIDPDNYEWVRIKNGDTEYLVKSGTNDTVAETVVYKAPVITTSGSSNVKSFSSIMGVTIKSNDLMSIATQYIGAPYGLGSKGSDTNTKAAIDCSGFVTRVYKRYLKTDMNKTDKYGIKAIGSMGTQQWDDLIKSKGVYCSKVYKITNSNGTWVAETPTETWGFWEVGDIIQWMGNSAGTVVNGGSCHVGFYYGNQRTLSATAATVQGVGSNSCYVCKIADLHSHHDSSGVAYFKMYKMVGTSKTIDTATSDDSSQDSTDANVEGIEDEEEYLAFAPRINSTTGETFDSTSNVSSKTVTSNSGSTIYTTNSKVYSFGNQYDTEVDNNFRISTMRGVFGMPYQFMGCVDPRISVGSSGTASSTIADTTVKRLSNSIDTFGRKYANEILSDIPLLLITPGKPEFMKSFTDDTKTSYLTEFVKLAGTDSYNSTISDTILDGKFGNYYDLEYAYAEYYQYVNPMCRAAAVILGLQNEEIDGIKLSSYEWSENINSRFGNVFSVYHNSTAWYCDSVTSISDNFSNGTTESMVASKLNGMSDYGRELQFLLGTSKSATGVALDEFVDLEGFTSSIDDFVNDLSSTSSTLGTIFSTLTDSISTIAQGGKIVFPKLWSDSSFSRSYTINLKLVSPDADNLSIYLNIIVPMLHLMGLVLPRESSSNRGYISPFLVRAFYKGLFNVNMGIISSMSFEKGKEAAWSVSGLPTIVEVSFEIQDLYEDMYLSDTGSLKNHMMNNIILLDYISNLCGININEPDIERSMTLFYTLNLQNKLIDTFRYNNIYLKQYVTNKVSDIFGKF